MEFPNRKIVRLGNYDYSQGGYYFVTVCTKDRESILSKITAKMPEQTNVGAGIKTIAGTNAEQIVGADVSVRPGVELTAIGKIIDECWRNIGKIYDGVRVDKYVIMPDHLHGIIVIDGNVGAGGQRRPPLPRIMQSFKSITTRRCFAFGLKNLWQRSFYDHIIRNEADYLKHWNYIEQNPIKWLNGEEELL